MNSYHFSPNSTSTNASVFTIELEDMTPSDWAVCDELVGGLADPPGPLSRASQWCWKRKRLWRVGNAISTLRYLMWRLDR